MGQKVHPIGMRVGIIRDWDAKWYAEKEYADYLHEDLAIRKFIQKELADASVSTIEIERAVNKVIVSLHTAKPGMVIGKGGSNVDALRAQLNKLTGKQVHINIVEIKKPDLDAHLVGETIARQLEQRVAFRRAQKQAIQRAMRAGAKGIKTQVSGRLNGADIARAEGYSEGTVPLHTLRADIDYAWEEADTTYGKLGGSNVDALRAQLNKLTGKQVHINIVEIKKPDLDAHLVGETIARQLEQRVAFRRAQKQAIQRAMRAGAKGIKTQVSGRLNGADIARAEGYSEGTVPLHTLRADIDYAWEEADTTYGKLGVKVWIYRGEVLPARKNTKGGK